MTNPDPELDLLSVDRAALLIGVDAAWLQHEAEAGRLPAILIGDAEGGGDPLASASFLFERMSLRVALASRAKREAVARGSATGIGAIIRERDEQRTRFDAAHDDGHVCGELAQAAWCYLLCESAHEPVPQAWPFEDDCWRPGHRAANLRKAGALIAAEIDRLHRQGASG